MQFVLFIVVLVLVARISSADDAGGESFSFAPRVPPGARAPARGLVGAPLATDRRRHRAAGRDRAPADRAPVGAPPHLHDDPRVRDLRGVGHGAHGLGRPALARADGVRRHRCAERRGVRTRRLAQHRVALAPDLRRRARSRSRSRWSSGSAFVIDPARRDRLATTMAGQTPRPRRSLGIVASPRRPPDALRRPSPSAPRCVRCRSSSTSSSARSMACLLAVGRRYRRAAREGTAARDQHDGVRASRRRATCSSRPIFTGSEGALTVNFPRGKLGPIDLNHLNRNYYYFVLADPRARPRDRRAPAPHRHRSHDHRRA